MDAGLYYLKKGVDPNDYLLVGADVGNFIGYAGALTDPLATPAAGDYYIASEAGDFTLFTPPTGGVLEVTKGDYLRWFESENKWILEKKYLNIKSGYDVPLLMDDPTPILFATYGLEDFQDANYGLTISCWDSSGGSVDLKRISKTAEGFEVEAYADCTMDWIAK